MNYTVVTPPTDEVLTLDEVKSYALRVVSTDDDPRIERLIRSARQAYEDFSGRILLESTLDVYFDNFADELVLPAPLISVTSVTYYDTANALQTLATTVYDVDAVKQPGRVTLASSQSWPSTYAKPNAVIVRCVCGSADADSVQATVMDGMYLFIQEAYDGFDRRSAYEALWWPTRIMSV